MAIHESLSDGQGLVDTEQHNQEPANWSCSAGQEIPDLVPSQSQTKSRRDFMKLGIGAAIIGIAATGGTAGYLAKGLLKNKEDSSSSTVGVGNINNPPGIEDSKVPEKTATPEMNGKAPSQFKFIAETGVSQADIEYIRETTIRARDYFYEKLGIYPQTLSGDPFSISITDSKSGGSRGGGAIAFKGFSIDVGSQIWSRPDGGSDLALRGRLMAHEYFHLVQAQLATRTSPSPLWMSEGSAEYASYKFINDLGIKNFQDVVDMWTRVVKNQKVSPKIGEIPSSNTYPAYPAYFVAVNRLVGEKGLESIAEYYKRLSTSGTPNNDAFERTFGISLEAFEAQSVI